MKKHIFFLFIILSNALNASFFIASAGPEEFVMQDFQRIEYHRRAHAENLKIQPLNRTVCYRSLEDFEKFANAYDKSQLFIADLNGFQPLHVACEFGNLDIVKFLLEKDADINCKNKSNSTPLHIALVFHQTEIAQYLIESGADINIKNKLTTKPIDLAIQYGHIDIVKLLANILKTTLHQPSDINPDHFRTIDILTLNSIQYGHLDIFKFLWSITKESTDNSISGILSTAARTGNINIIQYLINNKINVKDILKQDSSVFTAACVNDKTKRGMDMIIYLIKLCPEIIEQKTSYYSPIISTIYQPKVIRYILDELEYYPDIIIKPEHFNHVDYKFLQRNINVHNGDLLAGLKKICPHLEGDTCLEYFNAIKSHIKFIITCCKISTEQNKPQEISKLKNLKDLHIYFSHMQMAELIIEQINSENYDEETVIELIKLASQRFNLSRLKDCNFKTILSHSLASASKRSLSIFIICNYGHRDLLLNSISDYGTAPELIEIIKTFNANKLEMQEHPERFIPKKQESNCVVM